MTELLTEDPVVSTKVFQTTEPVSGTGDKYMEYLLERKRRAATQGATASVQDKPLTSWSSSTGSPSNAADVLLLRDIRTLFHCAEYEDFEFGMESDFVRSLKEEIEEHGIKAVQAIASVIVTRQAQPRVAAEALRWLGGISHPESYFLRLMLLEKCLSNSSRWVRDGALLGLDIMNDRHTIPALQTAVAREGVSGLRKDMQNVLTRISATP